VVKGGCEVNRKTERKEDEEKKEIERRNEVDTLESNAEYKTQSAERRWGGLWD
jgi:hypothetical protein